MKTFFPMICGTSRHKKRVQWKWKTHSDTMLADNFFIFCFFRTFIKYEKKIMFKHQRRSWKPLHVCKFHPDSRWQMGSFPAEVKSYVKVKRKNQFSTTYVMNRIGKLLRLKTKCAVLQIMNSAFARNRRLVGATGKNFVFSRHVDLLQLGRQDAVDFVIVLADKCWWINLDSEEICYDERWN